MNSIIELDFRPPSDARLEVEVLSISELRKRMPPAHHHQWLRAHFYRLYAVQSGHTQPVVDFVQQDLGPGDWMLVHPGQVLQYDFRQPWSGQLVVFQREALWEERLAHAQQVPLSAQLALAQGCVWRLTPPQHERMMHCVHSLHADMNLDRSLAVRNELLRLQLTAAFLRLMAWPRQEVPVPTSAAHQAYARFILLLEAQFAQHHQVAYYANQLGMHDKTLGRVIRSQAGPTMSAKKCIAQRLLLEAKRLLAHTTQPVQAIAITLGFDDPSNFVKFFRQHMGVSPLRFRQGVASAG
ncbi:AraC family transcriptional regulator [Rhodoferax sp.]|uniref:helix-turn-helix domain-containing protein n=1 Tax=Rhodoferax sp. TaxID=50421 RepID=UPI002628D7DF|nr:helix-turn-helix domain-containing protein [Rhodoferax sp.]MDD2925825.1 helix-turn-helix domain-containing protein [Rhodoferax sp.]